MKANDRAVATSGPSRSTASVRCYLFDSAYVYPWCLLLDALSGWRHRNAGAGREHVALFPVSIGLLMWAGIYLRDERVRALIPLRRS